MENDVNKILSEKRAWRTSERVADRRKRKDGSAEDRKLLADTLKAGRAIEHRHYCSCVYCLREATERKVERSAFMVAVCMLLALALIVFCSVKAHAYTESELATAIYHTENNKNHPYGILAHYQHTSPRQACINSIKHAQRDWNERDDFIVFLGRRYSPPDINPNWVRLVKYFLRKDRNEEKV